MCSFWAGSSPFARWLRKSLTWTLDSRYRSLHASRFTGSGRMNVFLSLPSHELELYTDLEQLQLELRLGRSRTKRKFEDLTKDLSFLEGQSAGLAEELHKTSSQLSREESLTRRNEELTQSNEELRCQLLLLQSKEDGPHPTRDGPRNEKRRSDTQSPTSACWEFLAHKPDGWSPIEAEATKVIERAYQIHRADCQVQIHRYLYRVDLRSFTQQNTETGKMRQLRRLAALTDNSQEERESREHKEKELGLSRVEWERSTFLRRRLETQLADAEEACKKTEVERDKLEREAWEAEGLRQELVQQLADSQEACKKKGLERDRLEREADEAASLRLQLEKKLADNQEVCEKKEIQVAELQAKSAELELQLKVFREVSKLKAAQILSALSDVSTLAADMLLRTIPDRHPKYDAVHDLFVASMTSHRASFRSSSWSSPPDVNVTRICEVANPTRQKLYETARAEEVFQRNKQGCNPIPNITAFKCTVEPGCTDLNEHLLFHGCPLHLVEDIARRGLDPRRGGEAVGSMFGREAYFAQNASKSDLYTTCDCCGKCSHKDCWHAAGERCILLVRVLLGESCSVTDQAVSDCIRAPERPDGELYESITAQAKDNGGRVDHMEFVSFEKQLSLVQYLVYYRHREHCSCHNCGQRRMRAMLFKTLCGQPYGGDGILAS